MPARRKLSDEQVREIRRLRQPRPTLQQLAQRYGVHFKTIHAIEKGHRYKEVVQGATGATQ